MEWLTSLDWFALSCWFGAIVLIVLGFAGTIVPAIPGLPMIAAGGWLIGWADHYEKVGFWTIAVLIVLAVIGVVVDSVSQTAGAQRAGASKAGIVGSIVGTVVGIPMGLFGIFVMPLVGAAVGEGRQTDESPEGGRPMKAPRSPLRIFGAFFLHDYCRSAGMPQSL